MGTLVNTAVILLSTFQNISEWGYGVGGGGGGVNKRIENRLTNIITIIEIFFLGTFN